MKIVPLAAESLGVRSMATYVEVGKTGILIDPGAALGPNRYNLPPAPAEVEALERAIDRIKGYSVRAQLISISHYHEDHFQSDPTLYKRSQVWVKNPSRMINESQKRRGGSFWDAVKPHCRLDLSDGKSYEFPDALVKASPPLSHGAEGTGFGYVIALTITDRDDGFRFVHASDVQGPASAVATAYLLRERPHLLYLSGPPTYLERQVGTAVIERGIENLLSIIQETGCRVILDHYSLRDPRHAVRLERLYETGKVVSAAGYLSLPEQLLEARRNVLWQETRQQAARPAKRFGRKRSELTADR
jgi:predicted metallo-beta-lactamase superfamily hydrolase